MVTCLFVISYISPIILLSVRNFELLSIIVSSGIANYMPVMFSTIDPLTLVHL